jgi:hypothetical protein
MFVYVGIVLFQRAKIEKMEQTAKTKPIKFGYGS